MLTGSGQITCKKPVSSQLAKRSFALPELQIEVKYLNCEHLGILQEKSMHLIFN